MWDGVERGEISPNEVKTLRFEQLVDRWVGCSARHRQLHLSVEVGMSVADLHHNAVGRRVGQLDLRQALLRISAAHREDAGNDVRQSGALAQQPGNLARRNKVAKTGHAVLGLNHVEQHEGGDGGFIKAGLPRH